MSFSVTAHRSLALFLPPPLTIFATTTQTSVLQETTLPKNYHFPNFAEMTQMLPYFLFAAKLLLFLYNFPF